MATMNPFDLLGDDDAEDPLQLVAAHQPKPAAASAAAAGSQSKKPSPAQSKPAAVVAQSAAKLPSKPLPPAQAEAHPNNILRCMKEKGVQGLTREHVASHLQKYQDKLRRINDAPLNTTPSNHVYLSTQLQRALAAGSISLGPNIGTQNFQNIPSMSNINTSLASPSQDCDIILEDVLASGDYSSVWNEEFPSAGEIVKRKKVK